MGRAPESGGAREVKPAPAAASTEELPLRGVGEVARLPETGVPPPSPMRSVGPSLPVALLLDPPLLSPMSSVGPSPLATPPPPLLCMPPPPPSAP